MRRVFYASPSQPAALGETVSNALSMLKNHSDIRRDRIRFTPWPEMSTSGKQLVDTILSYIDRADVFACDLTYPNPNVSFELGYAIGRFKRIWISMDTSIEGAKQRYRRIYYGLVGSGYAEYRNSIELKDAFIRDGAIRTLDQTLLGDIHRRPVVRQEEPVLLYVKPPMNTDSVNATIEALQSSSFSNSLIMDDPTESPSTTLEWYAGKLGIADAVLLHLLGNQQTGYLEHNVKCSLIAGISRGFQKSMLMLAQKPFESPIDFRGLLSIHDTASECRYSVQQWTEQLRANISPRRRRRPEDQTHSQQGHLDLRSLAIGEPVAENERQRLDAYFVETSTYFRAMDDPVTIVIGRRGVGKSAQLYAMQAALIKDRRNHVSVIKPVGYEIDGLVRVLRSIVNKSERGYLIESLWKFLIYSEVARSVYQLLESRPPYYMSTEAETNLMSYYNEHSEILSPPFSERLDVTLRSLSEIGEIADAVNQRQRISELLHSAQLRDLRDILGKVLSNYDKVSILIDNLDGQWGTDVYVESISELLWGLLQVSDDIVTEFQRADHWREAANINLTVFLRSDIFAFIQPTAPEQDKLPIQRITWDEPEVLKRLIDQRIEFGGRSTNDPKTVWDQLFPSEVVGYPTWEFVIKTVLPRPRDIVYLMREAIDGAVNRGHISVTVQDFLDAREKYSEYAFRSILAEDDPRKGKLESIMYEFAGSPKHINRSEIDSRDSLNKSVDCSMIR